MAFAATAIWMALTPAICAGQAGLVTPMARASVIDAAATPASAMATVSLAGLESKTLHVTVGHSIFVDTKTRLRRVYVADPAVLTSVTLTPTEIIVTAMAPGISSLTLLDEGGHAQSYVISSDIDIEGLRVAMKQAMRNDAVKVDGSGGRVTLSGIVTSEAMADSAIKLAALYSKDVGNAMTIVPGHPKQVRLQVRILEVDRSKALQQGINLFNPGGNTSFLAGSTTSMYPSSMSYASSSSAGNIGGGTVTTSSPLNFMLYSSKLNLGATIQDLESKQVLQILSEPTITTISGKKAEFLSGGEFPFPMVQPGSGTTNPVVTITFRPYGVKLEFTPIVSEDGTINLTVAPEVSALDYTNAVTIAGFTVPALSTRRAETQVELRSNESFAISGLLDQRTTDILSKNPGAASIPILGNLFKSKNINHSTTELIVVVTPTLVDPLTENTTPVQPEMPIPTLQTGSFDQSLGKHLNPTPAAPPIDPLKPPYGNQPVAPPAPAPAASPAAAIATPAPAKVAEINAGAPSAAQAAKVKPIAPTSSDHPASLARVAPSNVQSASAAVSQPNVTPQPGVRPAYAAASQPKQASPSSGSQESFNKISEPATLVEVMAVSHESDAEAAVAALNRRGYNVAINRDLQTSLLHLDIGPFPNKADAEKMRQRLLQDGYNATVK
jgi:pilus assembly protein CpaC